MEEFVEVRGTNEKMTGGWKKKRADEFLAEREEEDSNEEQEWGGELGFFF